jgi:hypothetical protein
MRILALGSLVTLILTAGLFVSQVEAKNDNNDDKGKNKQESKFLQKTDKHAEKDAYRYEAKNYNNDDTRSVPIPGTLLFMGGGFAGLVTWRAIRRKPRA